MANCCSGSPCDALVTIGKMKMLKDNASSCISVTSHSGYNGCCPTGGDSYVPTYSELENGTYAQVRQTYYNPEYDEDGFFIDSSGTSIGQNECVKQEFLYFGKTVPTSINLLSSIDYDACDSSNNETAHVTIRQINNFERHKYRKCDGDEFMTDIVDNVSYEITERRVDCYKTYSSNSAETSYNDDKTYTDVCEVFYNPSSVTISGSASSDCSRYIEAHSGVTNLRQYLVSVTVQYKTKYNCGGGDIFIRKYNDHECEHDVSIPTSKNDFHFYSSYDNYNWVEDGDITVDSITEYAVTKVTVGKNSRNYIKSKLSFDYHFGDSPKNLTLYFDRGECKISAMREENFCCGAFPTNDDWSGESGMTVCNCQ